ncbi:uncharacterized protein LOC142173708 [Nicotiana tabacum]|uniref:Uncharacterized protein LOC142173708 n=1 Tax=Nicotiana tabacum TaxID=4097 RepID=A0AC58TE09_TOBAC
MEASKKALRAWDKLCLPKSTGGLNLLNIHLWNKAAMCKLLWKLSKKKNILWVKWIHIYYGKEDSMWDKFPKQACWMIQKVFKAKQYIEEAGMTKEDLMNLSSFSIKQMYLKMLGEYIKVSWRRLICNNTGSLKWLFIVTMVAHGRLYTKDRLAHWGMVVDHTCLLCQAALESIEHLFFRCIVSTFIWGKILEWQGISRNVMEWIEEIQWLESNHREKSAAATYGKKGI